MAPSVYSETESLRGSVYFGDSNRNSMFLGDDLNASKISMREHN